MTDLNIITALNSDVGKKIFLKFILDRVKDSYLKESDHRFSIMTPIYQLYDINTYKKSIDYKESIVISDNSIVVMDIYEWVKEGHFKYKSLWSSNKPYSWDTFNNLKTVKYQRGHNLTDGIIEFIRQLPALTRDSKLEMILN